MDTARLPHPHLTIAEYLIRTLYNSGARHVFGVPGDYVLSFYAMLSKGPLQVINTCDEQGAGFAADAYARYQGIGIACVTYNVGGFKLVNTTAQAYAENSPVLVIAGAPGRQERLTRPNLHHKVREYHDQFEIFRQITVASTDLADPETAYDEIDRVISTVTREMGPGYIELPRDIINIIPGRAPSKKNPPAAGDHPEAVPKTLFDEILQIINQSATPVILAGEEVALCGLGRIVEEFSHKANIPIVSSMQGKSAVDETGPLYLGVYAGVVGDPEVKTYVEESDCVIVTGMRFHDVNLGAHTAHLDPVNLLVLSRDICIIRDRSFSFSGLSIVPLLCESLLVPHEGRHVPVSLIQRQIPFSPTNNAISAGRLFSALNSVLDDTVVVIADAGDAALGSLGIMVRQPRHYLSAIYYSSLGFAVPGSVGVKAALPDKRPLVLVGDGAFQMSGMELSTAARYGMDPIVVVLNNSGYGTERPMIDGPFNDIAPWQYSRIPSVIGCGTGYLVRTESEFIEALTVAKASPDLSLIEVLLDPSDISPELRNMCEGLAKGVKKIGSNGGKKEVPGHPTRILGT